MCTQAVPWDTVTDARGGRGTNQPKLTVSFFARAWPCAQVITADTSFSDPESPSDHDTRGIACSSVHLLNPTWTPDAAVGSTSGASFAVVTGQLRDGAPIDFALPPPSQPAARGVHGVDAAREREVCVDPLVGRQTVDGWWVKARVDAADADAGPASSSTSVNVVAPDHGGAAEPVYVLSMGEGFTVHYERAPLSVLQGKLLDRDAP